MEYKSIHVGDYGWKARVRCVKNGKPVDISVYTSFKIVFIKPNATVVELDAAIETLGDDGWLYAWAPQGLVDAAGTWKLYAKVTNSTSDLATDVGRFIVTARG